MTRTFPLPMIFWLINAAFYDALAIASVFLGHPKSIMQMRHHPTSIKNSHAEGLFVSKSDINQDTAWQHRAILLSFARCRLCHTV